MKQEINYAILGFGGIAKTHAIGSFSANLTLNLPYSLNLREVVTRNSLDYTIAGVENLKDIDEILKDEGIHFIDICTPNEVHIEGVKKASQHNKPIYCEKPLASNYREALEMAGVVREKRIINGVALMYRYMPAIRLIKKELQEGTIGDIIDFKIKLYHKSYLNTNKKGTWRTRPESGGGALMDLGVHLIDTIHFTMTDIESVDCTTRIFFKERTEVDEIASANFTLKNGVKGNLEVSRVFADSEEPATYVIYGTKGSIKMNSCRPYTIEVFDYEREFTYIKSAKGAGDILKFYPAERNSLGFHQDCHMASIVHFANLVAGVPVEENLVPTFEDALKAQRVIEASYLSASQNKAVRVEDII